jgi:hypothetical protein
VRYLGTGHKISKTCNNQQDLSSWDYLNINLKGFGITKSRKRKFNRVARCLIDMASPAEIEHLWMLRGRLRQKPSILPRIRRVYVDLSSFDAGPAFVADSLSLPMSCSQLEQSTNIKPRKKSNTKTAIYCRN